MKQKYVITSKGKIPGLSLSGPIMTPTEFEVSKVVNMVVNGANVKAINPFDSNRYVQLNRRNCTYIPYDEITGVLKEGYTEEYFKEPAPREHVVETAPTFVAKEEPVEKEVDVITPDEETTESSDMNKDATYYKNKYKNKHKNKDKKVADKSANTVTSADDFTQ